MRGEYRRLAVIAVVCLVVGGHGLRSPPGLFGFLATECSPGGDCTSYVAPFAASVILLGTGVLLALFVVVLLVKRRV